MLCQFDQSDCIVDYEVVLSGEFNTMGMVFVGQERGEQHKTIVVHMLYINIYVHVYAYLGTWEKSMPTLLYAL